MADTIIARREQQFPFHGSWRENLYPIPRMGATRHQFLKKTEEEEERNKFGLGSNQDLKNKKGKQNLRNVASDRAYKAYAQHETKKDHREPKEKRKVFRKQYESNGPNDDRYYVSTSSGMGQCFLDY